MYVISCLGSKINVFEYSEKICILRLNPYPNNGLKTKYGNPLHRFKHGEKNKNGWSAFVKTPCTQLWQCVFASVWAYVRARVYRRSNAQARGAAAAGNARRKAPARATSVRTGQPTPPTPQQFAQQRITVNRRRRLLGPICARNSSSVPAAFRRPSRVRSYHYPFHRTMADEPSQWRDSGVTTATHTSLRADGRHDDVLGPGVRATDRVQAEDVRQPRGCAGETVPERMGRRRGRRVRRRGVLVPSIEDSRHRQELAAPDHVPTASRHLLRLVFQSEWNYRDPILSLTPLT